MIIYCKIGLFTVLAVSCMGLTNAFCKELDPNRVIDAIVASHAEIVASFRPDMVILDLKECSSPGMAQVQSRVEWVRCDSCVLVRTSESVFAGNPKYEFHAKRKMAELPWTLSEVATPSRGHAQSSLTATSLALAEGEFTNMLIANHIPIVELLTHPTSKVVSCREADHNGQRVVSIAVDLDSSAMLENGLDMRFSHCVLSFTPDATGWIPFEIDMTGPTKDGSTFVNSAFEAMGEFLVPLQQKVIAKRPDGTRWEAVNASIEYRFVAVPREVFYLPHY